MTPPPQTLKTFNAILRSISYPTGTFIVAGDDPVGFYLQFEVTGKCNETAQVKTWRGRKWQLSKYMTKSEIVQTALMAVLAYEEHEVREKFKYHGVAIFGPHFNVDRLVTLAMDLSAQDTRHEPT